MFFLFGKIGCIRKQKIFNFYIIPPNATEARRVRAIIETNAVAMYKIIPLFRFFASSAFSLRVSFPELTVTRAEVNMKIISIM